MKLTIYPIGAPMVRSLKARSNCVRPLSSPLPPDAGSVGRRQQEDSSPRQLQLVSHRRVRRMRGMAIEDDAFLHQPDLTGFDFVEACRSPWTNYRQNRRP